jgi:hypothetical protein
MKNMPKLNMRKHTSSIQQKALNIELLKTIELFEKTNEYEFLSYEIDNVLLDIVKKRHEIYLLAEFGHTTI